MTPFQTLVNDPRTQKAIDNLKDRYELSEENVPTLLRDISMLPFRWRAFNKEKPDVRKERRRILSKQIRDLAGLIYEDQEARFIRIIDYESITNSPLIKNSSLLYQFLDCIADDFEIPNKARDKLDPFIKDPSGSNDSLKEFIQREIANTLYELLNRPSRTPNTAAVLLSNVMLNNLSDEVTKGQMTQVFRGIKERKQPED